jgi:hypothetical protein
MLARVRAAFDNTPVPGGGTPALYGSQDGRRYWLAPRLLGWRL